MSQQNRCLENHGSEEPLVIAERPIPKPAPKGAIIKTHCAGICHSDVHFLKGLKLTEEITIPLDKFVPDFTYPIVLGHEISGEIYELGVDYSGSLKVGDRVVVYPWIGCGECDFCKDGDDNLCSAGPREVLGVAKDGGYQKYLSLSDAKYAASVPDDVSMDVACLFGCSALTTFVAIKQVKEAIKNAIRRSGSANLLVIGAGGLGLWAIQWAKALLPTETKIFAADITEEKLQPAKQLGADGIIWNKEASDEELIVKTKEATSGGVDACIDLVGIPATVNKAINSAKKKATLVIIGLAGGVVSLPLMTFVTANVAVQGSTTGSFDDVEEMIRLFVEQKIEPPPLRKVALEDVESELKLLMEGKSPARAVVHFT